MPCIQIIGECIFFLRYNDITLIRLFLRLKAISFSFIFIGVCRLMSPENVLFLALYM